MPTIKKALAAALPTTPTSRVSPNTIADWQPGKFDAYDPSLKRAVAASAAFVREVQAGAPPRWLTFTGQPGCGKTTLAVMAYLEARKHNPADKLGAWVTGVGTYSEKMRRPGCRFLTATEFGDRCRREFDFPEQLGIEFLVTIDDLGAARDQSTFLAEAIYRLCLARAGKWTIFTTNFSLREIATQVDERVASRMIRDGSAVVAITASDYAMRKESK